MRRKIKKRAELEGDLRYSSVIVARFINQIMRSGKKNAAERIVYGALESIEKQTTKPALEALDIAMNNAGPQLELKSRRIGGANYQVPYEVKGERKVSLAMRWIIDAARKGKGKGMGQKLTEEIMAAYNNTGLAVKKKLDTHKMAEANRAFAHFAW